VNLLVASDAITLQVLTLLEELIEKLSIAITGAALWALYLHWRGRTFEKRLLLDISTSSEPFDEKRVLFVEIKLTNSGKAKLQAKPVKRGQWVYKDEIEQLQYSCSLQIRRINPNKVKAETLLDWYNCPALEQIPDVPTEINLLDEYILTNEDNRIEFWLEPGDIAYLPATLILIPGDYLLKVSFYGPDAKNDFWSRQIHTHLK